jgi:hypothetical protein
MMQNVMEVVIVTENDVSALKGRAGEQVVLVFRSIAKWMAKMRKRPKLQRFQCLDCDTAFHDHLRRDPSVRARRGQAGRDGRHLPALRRKGG